MEQIQVEADEADEVREFLERLRAERAAEAEREARRQVARDTAAAMLAVQGSNRLAVYGATQNTDLTEGKGGLRTIGWFLLPEEADLAHRLAEGVMGTENDGRPSEAVIYLSVEDWLADGGERSCNRDRLRNWREHGIVPKTATERRNQPGGWSAG